MRSTFAAAMLAVLLLGACSAGDTAEPAGDTTSSPDGTDGSQGTDAPSAGDFGRPAPVIGLDEPATITFTEVAEAAGIGGRVQQTLAKVPNCVFNAPNERITAESHSDCEQERISGGAAAADVDGDGWTDLYLTRFDGPDGLFLNRGDGTFQDVTQTAGLAEQTAGRTNGAGFADVNNDGSPDLYVTTVGDPAFLLFINDGSGRFTEEAAARGAAIADDAPRGGMSVAFGDYDRDGWIDIHTTEWVHPKSDHKVQPPHTRLLRNLGPTSPGSFEDVTESAGLVVPGKLHESTGLDDRDPDVASKFPNFTFGSAFVDLDGDGWQDLAITGDFGTSQMYWNDGDGTFSEGTQSSGLTGAVAAMGSAMGDVDADGDIDWFLTAIGSTSGNCNGRPCSPAYTGNRLFRNDGGRQFTDVSADLGVRAGDWGWGTTMFDVDNDSSLDLMMTNGYSEADVEGSAKVANKEIGDVFGTTPARLWHTRPAGNMVDITDRAGLTSTDEGRGVLVWDHDQDGDQDLLVIVSGGLPLLYRNDTTGTGSWLQVDVRSGENDRVALGAVVEVVLDDRVGPRRYEVGAATHFLAQSEPIAHFGTGDLDRVAQVKVTWPASGREVTLTDVEAGQRIVVRERDA